MDKKQFKDLLDITHKNLVNLTATKGNEYSRDIDQLANFKRQAAELNMSSLKVLMVYLNKHLDSIKFYVKTEQVLSEPIGGRIDDAILYLMLLKGLILDNQMELIQPTGRTLSGQIHPKAPQSQEPMNAHAQTTNTHPQFELR